MKTLLTAAVAATLLSASGAVAQSWTDHEPTQQGPESAQTAPTPAVPAPPITRYYDPAENEFVTVQPIGQTGAEVRGPAVARFYDPVENEFVNNGFQEPATGAIR